MAGDAISEALRDECTAEFAAGIGANPWRLGELAAEMIAAARAVAQPANDALRSSGGAWTFADRLARAYGVAIFERPRGAAGQYGGAVARRRLCWVVAGLPGALREMLATHEVLHCAADLAASEGAVWWLTGAVLYPESVATPPKSLADLYLSGAFHYPRWLAERRWSCLEILAAAQDEAV